MQGEEEPAALAGCPHDASNSARLCWWLPPGAPALPADLGFEIQRGFRYQVRGVEDWKMPAHG